VSIFLTIAIVMALLGVSAICSGLNVALMALDLKDLQRKAKIGDLKAKKVLPLRRNTHLTLAAILLSNVAAMSATSLVLEDALTGLVAGVISTLLIVIFGEIFPQALFSRQALIYCARLSIAMRLMIFVMYPIAKPLQLLLDKLFSKQQLPFQLHSRQELGVMIAEHLGSAASELDDDEIEIIRGALKLSEKRVREIMMPIKQVFWVTPKTELTRTKINEIKSIGRSRIPVFNTERTHCYGVLLMKDLVDIDFDAKLYTVQDLSLHYVQPVGSMTALDTLLRRFIATSMHLIPVEKDDRIVGIVTIEDVIEEIVGHEIEDETDRRKRRATLA
jgi:metal transporter CNNM